MLETDDMRVRRNVAFTKMSNELTQLRADLARRDEIIRRLVEDGERLASRFIVTTDHDMGDEDTSCIHCGGDDEDIDTPEIVHAPDCPITLHRALMKEVEG